MRKIAVMVAGLAFVTALADAQPEPKEKPTATATTKVESAKKVPASQPATVPAEPKTVEEAVETGKEAVGAAQAGQWWYFSSLVCLIVMFILKRWKVLKSVGRWKYIILPILSLAAALLAAFQGGVGLAQAIGVFSASWAMGMFEELVNHGILGKPHGESPG